MYKTVLQEFVEDTKQLKLFQQEKLIAEIGILLEETMEEENISEEYLANRLNRVKGYVRKVVAGDSNLTVRRLADLFTALGKSLKVSVENISE
jgi:plasmid maintenance system antidote protein VapI